MQIVLYYCYIKPLCSNSQSTFAQIVLLLFTTAITLGAGNIVNDIYDRRTDNLKPTKLSILEIFPDISSAFNLYKNLLIATGILIIVGLYVGWSLYLPLAVIIVTLSLFLYSAYVKNTIIYGNLLVALLCAASVWVVPLAIKTCMVPFDFSKKAGIIFWGYILNAFLVNFIREIIKDQQDWEYDKQAGLKTTGFLPLKTVRILINGIVFILAISNAYGIYLLAEFLDQQNINLGILILFTPLVPLLAIINSTVKNHTFSFLSKLIKVYILLGLLLLVLWQ